LTPINPRLEQAEIQLDERLYRVEVSRQVVQPPEHPRLVVVAYQPNRLAREILAVCLRSLQRFTPEPHELWVIDNHSPGEEAAWLLQEPGLNVILNRTEPLPPGKRGWWREWPAFQRQQQWGSYANAIALELAARLVDPGAHYLMPLHMDTLAACRGWLGYLSSKLDRDVRAAGVLLHKDRIPEGVLHVLGYMVDFRLFQELNLDFFPELPALDVGDRVSLALRRAGYEVFGCRNTYNQPELADEIPDSSPWKNIKVFRALDDENQVIFLHLGRGVRRSTGEHRRGLRPEEWISFAHQYLLS
jgi:hypothetical protein